MFNLEETVLEYKQIYSNNIKRIREINEIFQPNIKKREELKENEIEKMKNIPKAILSQNMYLYIFNNIYLS